MSILTAEAVEGYYRSEITADRGLIDAACLAADQGIFEICQRKFAVAGSAAARSYAPRVCSRVLRVHDCTSVTSVVENGVTLTANTDYVCEPVQQVSWSGETRPFEQIRRRSGYWHTDDGLATVTVTAPWGWSAIPAPITQAAYVAVKDILDARETRFGIADISQFGPLRVRQNPMVQQLCAPYRRVEAFGIG